MMRLARRKTIGWVATGVILLFALEYILASNFAIDALWTSARPGFYSYLPLPSALATIAGHTAPVLLWPLDAVISRAFVVPKGDWSQRVYLFIFRYRSGHNSIAAMNRGYVAFAALNTLIWVVLALALMVVLGVGRRILARGRPLFTKEP
jgi:hypothetical protein